jgi:hypothetical protein
MHSLVGLQYSGGMGVDPSVTVQVSTNGATAKTVTKTNQFLNIAAINAVLEATGHPVELERLRIPFAIDYKYDADPIVSTARATVACVNSYESKDPFDSVSAPVFSGQVSP